MSITVSVLLIVMATVWGLLVGAIAGHVATRQLYREGVVALLAEFQDYLGQFEGARNEQGPPERGH